MNEIESIFKLKNDKTEEPEIHLGAQLQKRSINRKFCWTMSITPMASGYIPELDMTPNLDFDNTQFYPELIGMLRWATEIGRVDILHEVSILLQYQASPREGHIEQLFHIWRFLKRDPKLTLYFDPMQPIIDYSVFKSNVYDFKE
eukprot:CAMPEP_0197842224 /NCGR_PEP_ID=MMETSP1437-20131217/46620_1 /TAXON_ID=49252 ORGANISM="Eucampia antarctica, Strain CCMP1452" /NCGR_SAMPLE_ID=MMETSP1437 /ASSEMBLY_ACC=CAM_ASM_001096 /LENGTH=144 /DNA_ID=CAMNT_0043452077 /DNA_START=378 /DNA_END=812 /DNA_ORIENTATION=-